MRPEINALLFDIQHAAMGIELFVAGKTLLQFKADLMLQSAVERQLEIIGEAMTRLRRLDPQFIEQITDYRKIIGLRNILIHGYDTIDVTITWNITRQNLPILRKELEHLLKA